MIKKLISGIAGAGMVLATVSPVFAAVGCSNITTGPTSNNVCNTILSKVKTLGLTNTGNVTHNVTKNAVSGNNVANNNTSVSGGLTINTGNSAADVESLGQLNTANVSTTQTDPAADQIGGNDTTGPSSNNIVGVTNAKTAALTIGNSGDIVHRIRVNSWSGYNTANNNTIVGGIQTGESSSTSFITSILNDSIVTTSQ